MTRGASQHDNWTLCVLIAVGIGRHGKGGVGGSNIKAVKAICSGLLLTRENLSGHISELAQRGAKP